VLRGVQVPAKGPGENAGDPRRQRLIGQLALVSLTYGGELGA
jgi:hypothetical protein